MATILVADDNRANRDAMAALLETAGHRVLSAADGREAFERAREHRPDLVISDVLMPEMDGYELARRLQLDTATAGTVVLFYTAYFSTQEAKDLALAHGVARVLVKPSDNDAILAAVDEVLSARAGPRAVPSNLDREHLRVMVDQLLEKTGALEAQQRRVQRLNRTLSMMSAVNALIVRASDRQALLDEACRIAIDKGGFRLAAVGLVDHRSQAMQPAAAAGEGSAARDLARLKPGARAVIWNDAESGAFVALPLIVGGETTGVLLLYARVRDFFDEEEMRLLQELAGDVSFALQHLEQKARMDYLAYHDSLTELPNRSLFIDRIGQALNAARRQKRFAAAVFLDVERFRMVNETFGRKSGDDLLRQVGARLCEVAREGDTVARVGADHFAIAVAGFDHPGETTHWLIDRLAVAFARPFVVDGVELVVSLKAGVAVFPTDGESTEALCAHAESALKHAKDSDQRFLFYAPEMNARVAEALAMENRLRRAINDGLLSLHYQPKIDVQQRRARRPGGAHPLERPGAGQRAALQVRLADGGNRHHPRRRQLGAAPGRARHPPLACRGARRAAHLGQRLGDPAAAEGLRRLRARPRSAGRGRASRCSTWRSPRACWSTTSRRARGSCRRCAAPASRSRSTTSAPGTARSATSRACRWIRSRSTAASWCAWATPARRATSWR